MAPSEGLARRAACSPAASRRAFLSLCDLRDEMEVDQTTKKRAMKQREND